MACCMKTEHEEVKHVLTNLITQLCKNGVKYSDKLHIEGLVGVTVDHSDVFFVRISETIDKAPKSANSTDSCAARNTPRNTRPHNLPHRQGSFSSGRRTHSTSPSPHRQSPLLASGVSHRVNAKSSPSSYRAAQSPTVRKPPGVNIKPEVVELDDDDDDDGDEQKEDEGIRPTPIQTAHEIVPSPAPVQSTDSSEQETAPAALSTGTEGTHEFPLNVTVIAPSDSDLDDTQAMRQGYPAQEQPDVNPQEDLQPPAKRMCIESSPMKPTTPVFAGQWPMLAAESGNSSSSPAVFTPATIISPEIVSILEFKLC